MAVKERDVVLMGKDGEDSTIDMPITRLGLIEDGAEAKTTLADADAIPVVDSADSGEMKKIAWGDAMGAIKGKLDGVYATVESAAEAKETAGAADHLPRGQARGRRGSGRGRDRPGDGGCGPGGHHQAGPYHRRRTHPKRHLDL